MDFTPDGPSHSNNAASNQNEIFARSLDKDGVKQILPMLIYQEELELTR